MRTKPVIGRKAWFGPHRVGWGLAPVTAGGWTVVAIGVAAIIALSAAVPHAHWLGLVMAAVLIAVVFLKGTSPGGSREWAEWKASERDR